MSSFNFPIFGGEHKKRILDNAVLAVKSFGKEYGLDVNPPFGFDTSTTERYQLEQFAHFNEPGSSFLHVIALAEGEGNGSLANYKGKKIGNLSRIENKLDNFEAYVPQDYSGFKATYMIPLFAMNERKVLMHGFDLNMTTLWDEKDGRFIFDTRFSNNFDGKGIDGFIGGGSLDPLVIKMCSQEENPYFALQNPQFGRMFSYDGIGGRKPIVQCFGIYSCSRENDPVGKVLESNAIDYSEYTHKGVSSKKYL